MRKRKFSFDTIERAISLAQEAKTALDLRLALSVLLPAKLQISISETGKVLGRSRSSIFRMQNRFEAGKYGEMASEWGGRRKSYLDIQEEKDLLRSFSKEAFAGIILEVGDIKRAYEAKIGRAVNKTTIYRMLARHGWRKIAPRPTHPKADAEQQENFKKNFQRSWRPT